MFLFFKIIRLRRLEMRMGDNIPITGRIMTSNPIIPEFV
jgi:hypothetical protein